MLPCRDALLLGAIEAIGLPLVQMRQSLFSDAMQFMDPMPALLAPLGVRNYVRANLQHTRAACTQHKSYSALLLAYCMRDVDDLDPGDLVSLGHKYLNATYTDYKDELLSA